MRSTIANRAVFLTLPSQSLDPPWLKPSSFAAKARRFFVGIAECHYDGGLWVRAVRKPSPMAPKCYFSFKKYWLAEHNTLCCTGNARCNVPRGSNALGAPELSNRRLYMSHERPGSSPG